MAGSKGYVKPAEVGLLLGVDLTAEQQMKLSWMLPAAEQEIDAATGSAWLTGPIVGERYVVNGYHIYLKSRPVASIQSLQVRYSGWHSFSTLPAGDTGYYVEDANEGIIGLWQPASYDIALVSYTPAGVVPEPIREATARLLMARLGRDANGVGGDVKSFSVFGQVTMTYMDRVVDSGPPAGMPTDVWELIRPYARMAGLFA